jgi:hypothetical protein
MASALKDHVYDPGACSKDFEPVGPLAPSDAGGITHGESPLTVCFFDGTFGGFTKPPTLAAQVYDRIVMIIDSTGQPYLDTAGFRATTLVEIPRRKP